MELVAQTRIAFPQKLVFETYRDRLPDLVPYLPNVEKIETKERKEEGSKTKLLNIWKAKTEIPAVAQKFLKPEMLMWKDFAEWDAQTMSCKWRIELNAFPEGVECSGTTTCVPVGDNATDLVIKGDLILHLEKTKIVPRLLASTVAPHIEKIVVASLKPNLLATGQGVEKYLQAHKK